MNSDLLALLLIVALGLATYFTRIGGYLMLARFERLNPRVEAALDAVPAAVLTAVAAPVVMTSGVAEAIAAGVAIVASIHLPIHGVLILSVAAVVGLRAAGL